MKMLLQETLTEDWKQNVAAGLLGASLVAAPAVTDASGHNSHHKHQAHHSHGLPHRSYSENDIINSIVGEEAKSYEGMLGVACAIRNKMKNPYYKNNILHGVEGRHAAHLKNERPETFELAKKAWAESAHKDITGGAYLWGYPPDIEKWKTQSWFKNVEPTVTLGSNTFFRNKR